MQEITYSMYYHNFIMSYHPHFNARAMGYNNAPTFTPWSQSINGSFSPNLSVPPFKALPFNPYSPYPLLIHQQNNYYNSNFSFNQPAIDLSQTFLPNRSFLSLPQLKMAPNFLSNYPRKANPLPQQVIQISDDQAQLQPKSLVAVIKQKMPLPPTANYPTQSKLVLNHKQQKYFIQQRKEIQIKNLSSNQSKKDTKANKRYPKCEGKEGGILAKKKKIYKEKFTYRLSEEEKALMELSRYRQYRPDLIMVGPQFQAKIPNHLLLRRAPSWLFNLRESLLQRRHD